MLELISKDIPNGSKIKLYLITGDTIEGVLIEVGSNYVVVEEDSSRKRFFEQMIGGWDIIDGAGSQKSEKDSYSDNDSATETDLISYEPIQEQINRFIESLSEEESAFVFSPNARIISADKRNVVIRTNDEGESFYVPYKFIASKGVISDVESFFLSGEDSQNTSIPVFVSFYGKDKNHAYPNIVLEPGTMLEYCNLLSTLSQSPSSIMQAKILSFIIWRGCKKKHAREELKTVQDELKTQLEGLKAQQGGVKAQQIISRSIGDKDFLANLDEQIKNSTEKGQDINPLLLRKAQWLSSKNRYQDAIDAYSLLNESLRNKGESSAPSISHNYVQIAIMQMKLKDFERARLSIKSALEFNPDNAIARNYQSKLDSSETTDSVEIDSIQTPEIKLQDITDSVLLDDLSRHVFADPEALSNSDSLSIIVAERLLSQAESDESQASYLDAAKAYSLIEISGEEESTSYAKAMYGYASSRAKQLYNFLVNQSLVLSEHDRVRAVDGAYCYFVSSINYGSFLGHNWSTHFRDYLRMRVFDYACRNSKNANSIFELPINEFIEQNRLQDDFDFLLECSEVLISIGARCPGVRFNLHGDSGKSLTTILDLLNSLPQKEQFCKLLSQKNKLTHIRFTGSAEHLIEQFIDHRINKLGNLNTRVEFIKNKSTESLFEASIAPAFKRLRKSSSFLTSTDLELSIEAERTMGTLAIFRSRTSDERRILAPSVKAEITKQIEQIQGYSSYLCSDLLRELWNRLLKSKYLSVNEASSALRSELTVSSDGNILISSSGGRIIPISVMNEGRSTIDKFKATVVFSERLDSPRTYEGKRLAPGEAATVNIEIPSVFAGLSTFDYKVELSGLIINTWSSSKEFNLTAYPAHNVSFKTSDIKWNYQAKELRQGMFKGRDSDIDNLIKTFTTNERTRIPIVFGLTRTGKSSILLNLKGVLSGKTTEIYGSEYKIAPVYIDLATLKSQYRDHDSFMLQLLIKCNDEFSKVGIDITASAMDSFADIIEYTNSKKIYPVFMFDEFSWVKSVIEIEGNDFLKSIREYAIEQKAGFIYAGTYDILDIIRNPELNPSGTFMNIDEYKIYNIKDPKEAEALMRVMEPQLQFTNPAINAIHDYSGDVPYWIQLICYQCAHYAISNNRPVIGSRELEDVVKGILGESNCAGVNKIADYIFEQQQTLTSDPKETKALLFSIAYLMKDKSNKNGVSWSRLKEFWSENEYTPDMESIVRSKERLEDRLGLLSQEIDGTRVYRFSVGLFRRWCAKKDVFSEFDKTKK